MTTHDILRIVLHVSILQCTADLVTRKFVFEQDSYQRLVSTLERMRVKRDKVLSSNKVEQQQQQSSSAKSSKTEQKSMERNTKKLQRADDDFKDVVAQVSRKHAIPSFVTSVLFLILYRILQEEYRGKIIAVLPFTPWAFVQRITRRGLGELALNQDMGQRACGFLFIYMLSTMSVKFIVHKLCAVRPPRECEGMSPMLDAPKAQKVMKKLGLNVEDMNEAREAARQVWG